MKPAGVSVELSPAQIFAGTDFTLTCRVQCSPPRDLRGRIIHIESDDGTVLGSATLGAFNGVANRCEPLALTAPPAAGCCTWSVVLGGAEESGDTHGNIALPVTFEALPHRMSVLIWGGKAAVAAGEAFRVMVALRCGCRCPLNNQKVAITDHRGHRIDEVTMSESIWPGSEAVYFAEVPLVAPDQEGRFTWQVSAIASDAGVSHEGMAELELLTTRPPECIATITTLDEDDRTPLCRATVSMYPFTALSDEHGIATLRILKGDHCLLVSAANHAATSRRVKIEEDFSTTVKLARDEVHNPYADWHSTV